MIVLIYLLIVIPIVYFTTRNRSMSFGWGLFFSIFYSLIPGLIIILSSGKKGYSNKYKNKNTSWGDWKTILCFLFGAIFLIYGLANYNTYSYSYNKSSLYTPISIGIGLIGNGIYLLSDMDEIFTMTDEENIKKANDYCV